MTAAGAAAPGPAEVALVTGASSGIGAAFARALAARGHRVVLVARRADRLGTLVDALGGPGRAEAIPLDLAAAGAPARLREEVEARGLDVALLVNNAGVGHSGRFVEQPLDRVLEMVEINARVATEMARLFLPPMVHRGRGALVNVVSMSAFQPVPYLSVYAATKAYLLSFSEGLHAELAGTGVRVQALCPGNIPTEFQERAGTTNARYSKTPAMSADDVARASLDALEKGTLIVIPAVADRLSVFAQRFAPRALVRRIAGGLFKPAD